MGEKMALYLVNQQHINDKLLSNLCFQGTSWHSYYRNEREEKLFSLTLLVYMDSKDMP